MVAPSRWFGAVCQAAHKHRCGVSADVVAVDDNADDDDDDYDNNDDDDVLSMPSLMELLHKLWAFQYTYTLVNICTRTWARC